MNVIVGRRPDGQGGFVLDKFSLYYPDNSLISPCNNSWDLMQGYSFRTAALSGSLNRAGLHGLGAGLIPLAEGTEFDAAAHGLVIDDASAYDMPPHNSLVSCQLSYSHLIREVVGRDRYEDCAYVDSRAGETNEDRGRRIDGMVKAMVAAYGSQGILSLSYDPAERQQGMTVLESEWRLLKRVADEESAAVPEPAMEPAGSFEQVCEDHMRQHEAALAAAGVVGAALEQHLQQHLQQLLQAQKPAGGGARG